MTLTLQRRLESLRERIREGKDLYRLIPYELMPLMRDTPMLNAVREQRVHYYERLAKDPEYADVINGIHGVLRRINPFIDPSQLPGLSLSIFMRVSRDRKNRLMPRILSSKDFLNLFTQKETWHRLGSISCATDPQSDDSHFCPWRNVLRQYKIVEDFLDQIPLDPRAEPFREELKRFVTRLHQLLEEPWHRLHIGSFERIEQLVPILSRQIGQEDEGRLCSIVRTHLHSSPQVRNAEYKKIQRSADVVCGDLLLVVGESSVAFSGNSEHEKNQQDDAIAFRGKLRVLSSGIAWWNGIRCKELEPRIGKMMYVLVQNKERQVTPLVLHQTLYGPKSGEPRKSGKATLRKYVSRVRLWLKGHSSSFEIIVERGEGWIFTEK